MGDPRLWQRLHRRPLFRVALAVLLILAAAAVLGPELLPGSLADPGPLQLRPPSPEHWFGTDLNGRDVFYRTLLGLRISLVVGIAGALVSVIIGTAWGLTAGFLGGRTDAVMMRIVDVLYAVPRLIFILILISALDERLRVWASTLDWPWLVHWSRVLILIFALGFIEWLTMARVVRAQVMSLRERDFITAARALGQSPVLIAIRHILPNTAGLIVIYATLTVPAVIIDESFLSFLGLGVSAPLASLGMLLSDGAAALNPLRIPWWLLVFPAAVMAALLLALNYLGDCLRDALSLRQL